MSELQPRSANEIEDQPLFSGDPRQAIWEFLDFAERTHAECSEALCTHPADSPERRAMGERLRNELEKPEGLKAALDEALWVPNSSADYTALKRILDPILSNVRRFILVLAHRMTASPEESLGAMLVAVQAAIRAARDSRLLSRSAKMHGNASMRVDIESLRVVMEDGTILPIATKRQAEVLAAIVKADGYWVSSSEFREKENPNEKVDRIVRGLPDRVRSRIESKPGAGYRLLPPMS